jgi:hypothetical protein
MLVAREELGDPESTKRSRLSPIRAVGVVRDVQISSDHEQLCAGRTVSEPQDEIAPPLSSATNALT